MILVLVVCERNRAVVAALSACVSGYEFENARCTDRLEPRLSSTEAYLVPWPGSWPPLVNVN